MATPKTPLSDAQHRTTGLARGAPCCCVVLSNKLQLKVPSFLQRSFVDASSPIQTSPLVQSVCRPSPPLDSRADKRSHMPSVGSLLPLVWRCLPVSHAALRSMAARALVAVTTCGEASMSLLLEVLAQLPTDQDGIADHNKVLPSCAILKILQPVATPGLSRDNSAR